MAHLDDLILLFNVFEREMAILRNNKDKIQKKIASLKRFLQVKNDF